ncbi:MAG: hypothetical protein Q4B26_11955 [Eubacteriales bacterium]|nr:hypothetical protein [Eubacteriales bacterium]
MVKYYSTQRPIAQGTYPTGYKVRALVNFDFRAYMENIGRPAWGWIAFDEELPEDVAKEYELVKANEYEQKGGKYVVKC